MIYWQILFHPFIIFLIVIIIGAVVYVSIIDRNN